MWLCQLWASLYIYGLFVAVKKFLYNTVLSTSRGPVPEESMKMKVLLIGDLNLARVGRQQFRANAS
jgi:hypothetical protein